MMKKWTSLLLVLALLALPTGCFGDGETASSQLEISSDGSQEISSEGTDSAEEQLPDNKLTDAEIIDFLIEEEVMDTSRNLAMKSTVKETVETDGFKMTTTSKAVFYSLELEDAYEYYLESEIMGTTYIECYRDGRYYWMEKIGDENEGYSEEMTKEEFFYWYWGAENVSVTAGMLREATVVREGNKMTVTYEGVSEAFGKTLLSSVEETQGNLGDSDGATNTTVTACSYECVIENGVTKKSTMSATGEIVDEDGQVISTVTVTSENEYLGYGPDADFEVPLPDNLSQLPDYEEYWEDQDGDLIGL